LLRRIARRRAPAAIEQLIPSLGLRIRWIFDLPPVHTAPVGIALTLRDNALEVALLHGHHESLPTPLHGHCLGNEVIGAAAQRRLRGFFRSMSGALADARKFCTPNLGRYLGNRLIDPRPPKAYESLRANTREIAAQDEMHANYSDGCRRLQLSTDIFEGEPS
jgi:hypothetical protein